MERSTSWIAVGSVESRTKKCRPDGAGNVSEKTSGARLDPPMPSNTMSRTPDSGMSRAQILERGRFRAHGIEHANPAEPVGDDPGMFGIILPKARLPGPHFLNRLAGSKSSRFFLIDVRQIDRVKYAALSGAWDPLGRGN